MPKILIYTPKYPPQTGGAASYFSNLVGKQSDNHGFIVLTTREQGEALVTQEESAKVYRIIPNLHRPPLLVRTAIPSFIAFILGIYMIVFRGIYVVHSHSNANAAPGLAVATVMLNIPLIYDCRDEEFPLWLVTFGNVNHWFSCSSNIDQRLREAGVPEDRITRIPVVNPEYVSKCAVESNHSGFSIVFAGTINCNKGIHIFLRAFQKFQSVHEDVHLIIIGDGPELQNVKEWVANSDCSEKITVQGQMTHRKTLSEISKASTLVLPSASEGLPRVVVEAFELGTPVVATPVGGVPDLITHQRTGLLVERDADEIAAALERLYSSSDLQERISKNAFERIENQDWETVTKRLSGIYCDAYSGS